MEMNWWLLFVTALVPLVIGAIYYSPKVVGGTWMKVNNFTMKDLEGANMLKIFGVTYFLGILLSFALLQSTIHQMSIAGAFQNTSFQESGTEAHRIFTEVMDFVGGNFRTFKHGAFHGILLTLLLVWPVLSINAMFERRGWKYVAIHLGYWVITLGLMGGLICAYV